MKKCLGLDLIREDCTYGGREGHLPLAAQFSSRNL